MVSGCHSDAAPCRRLCWVTSLKRIPKLLQGRAMMVPRCCATVLGEL